MSKPSSSVIAPDSSTQIQGDSRLMPNATMIRMMPEFAGTEGFKQSRRERKKIEMRFAHLKRILRLGRRRLRGPRGAQDEFVLAAIAQNLRRLAALVARPPPAQVLCIA